MASKHRLANWLLELIDLENQAELCREVLCMQDTFHPFSVFRYLDSLGNGYLCSADLSKFIIPRIPESTNSIRPILSSWDLGLEGRLSYKDLAK